MSFPLVHSAYLPPPPAPVDEEAAAADSEDALFIRDRTVRQSSLSTGAVDAKKAKRRPGGLLKGLGSMFRSVGSLDEINTV